MTQTVDRPADVLWPAEEPIRHHDDVVGVYCKKSHFNDPRVYYCGVCGMAMAQTTRVPVWARRPQLGVLVLDNGTMIPVLRDLVLGRAPGIDPQVVAGHAVPVKMVDPVLSRVHARIELRGWDLTVSDAGSSHGTYVEVPGRDWRRLEHGAAEMLVPGSRIAVGRRQLHFYSNRNP